MYELLHKEAPQDELEFYLSYAKRGDAILEALCGSGRFLLPFLERGFNIKGVDSSQPMLQKLLEKAPGAPVIQSRIEAYQTRERFDYIFISSGSVSLFTDMAVCKTVLSQMKSLLKPEGKFVFAVDTVANRCPDRESYHTEVVVDAGDGRQLALRSKSRFDEATQTQFSPSLYELYGGGRLLRREEMDFQTHLYKLGEMDAILKEIGFQKVLVYASFDKEPAQTDDCESFLYECSL